jgi:hypothetical protein
MGRKISQRLTRCMEIAKTVPYTKEEFSILQQIIDGLFYAEGGSEYYAELSRDIYTISQDGSITETVPGSDDDMGGYGSLNLMQYLLVNYRRVFLFLTRVPSENVLLYVNDPILDPFVRWRLTIAR